MDGLSQRPSAAASWGKAEGKQLPAVQSAGKAPIAVDCAGLQITRQSPAAAAEDGQPPAGMAPEVHRSRSGSRPASCDASQQPHISLAAVPEAAAPGSAASPGSTGPQEAVMAEAAVAEESPVNASPQAAGAGFAQAAGQSVRDSQEAAQAKEQPAQGPQGSAGEAPAPEAAARLPSATPFPERQSVPAGLCPQVAAAGRATAGAAPQAVCSEANAVGTMPLGGPHKDAVPCRAAGLAGEPAPEATGSGQLPGGAAMQGDGSKPRKDGDPGFQGGDPGFTCVASAAHTAAELVSRHAGAKTAAGLSATGSAMQADVEGTGLVPPHPDSEELSATCQAALPHCGGQQLAASAKSGAQQPAVQKPLPATSGATEPAVSKAAVLATSDAQQPAVVGDLAEAAASGVQERAMSQLPQAATSDAQQPAVSKSCALPGGTPAASCAQERVDPELATTPSEGMPQAPVPQTARQSRNSPQSRHRSRLPQELSGSESELAARMAGLSSSGSSRAPQRPDAGKTLLRAGGSLLADLAAEGSRGSKLSAEQEPPQPPDATAEVGRGSGLSAKKGSPQPPSPAAVPSRGSSLPAEMGSPQPECHLPCRSREFSLPVGQGSAQPAGFCTQADQGREARLLRLHLGRLERTVLSRGDACNTPDMLRPLKPAQPAAGPDLQAGSASQAPASTPGASQATAPGRKLSSSTGAPRQGPKHAAGHRHQRCNAENPGHASEGHFSIPAAWRQAGRQSLRGRQHRVPPNDQGHTAAIMSHAALESTLAHRGSQPGPQRNSRPQVNAEQLAAHADSRRGHGQGWQRPMDSFRPQQGPTTEQLAAGTDRPTGQVPRQQVSLPPPAHPAFNLRRRASITEQGAGQASLAAPFTRLLPLCSPTVPPPPPSRVPALPQPAAAAGPPRASAALVRLQKPLEVEWQGLADSRSSRLVVQWQLPNNEIIPRTPFTAAVQTLQWHQEGGVLNRLHSCQGYPWMQNAGPIQSGLAQT